MIELRIFFKEKLTLKSNKYTKVLNLLNLFITLKF